MGIRSLQVPANAQPQDLPDPVPNGGEPSFQDVVSQLPNTRQAMVSTQAPMQGPSLSDVVNPSRAPASSPQSAPAQQNDETALQADAIKAEFQSQEADTEHFKKAVEDDHRQAVADEFGSAAPQKSKYTLDTVTQMSAASARGPTGRLSALQNHYGKSNVSYKGGVYTIQTANGEITTSDKELLSWSDWKNYPGLAVEMGAGSFLTKQVAKGISSMAFEGGIAAPLAAGTVGPAVAAGLAAGVGFGVGHYLRDAVNEKVLKIQEEEDYHAGQEAMQMGGFAFVGDALVAPIVSAAGKGIASGLMKAVNFYEKVDPVSRVKAAQTVRLGLNETLKGLKMPLTTVEGKLSADLPAIARGVQTAVDSADNYWSSRVGLFKDKAIALGNKNNLKFQPSRLMQEIKAKIGNYVSEGADGRLSLSIGQRSADPLAMGEFEFDNAQLKAAQESAFGDPNGVDAVKDMLAKYNVLLDASKQGGVPIDVLMNEVGAIDRIPATWATNSKKSPDLISMLKSIRTAASADQREAVLHVLEGTPEGKIAETANLEYSSRIDAITRIQGKYNNQGFLDSDALEASFFQPKSSVATSNLKDVMRIVDPDSSTANNIRGAWISQRINDAIDIQKPVFDANKFIASISEEKWGSEFTNTLFKNGVKDLNNLKLMAKRAEGIVTSDMWKNTKGIEAVIGLANFNKSSGGLAKTLFRIVRANPDLATYLSEEGLAKYASELGTPEAVQSFMKDADVFKAVVDSCAVVDAQGSNLFKNAKIGGKVVKKILVPISKAAFREAFGQNRTSQFGLHPYDPNSNLAQQNAEAQASQVPDPSMGQQTDESQSYQPPGE